MSEFMNWLDDQDKHTDLEKREMTQIWEAGRINIPKPPATEEMWADLRTRIALADQAAHTTPSTGSWLRRFFGAPLPALAMVLVVCVGVWLAYDNLRPSFEAERGIRSKMVTLGDNSAVTLNADSSLALSVGFNKKNRKVQLEGEAYFEVEKGQKPFVIKAGEATIEVVGTKFNVYSRGDIVRLDVTEGVVKFSTADGQNAILLHAGESSVAVGDNAPKQPEPNALKDQQPKWMEDMLDFKDEVPLTEICEALERRFNIHIKFSDDAMHTKVARGLIITKSTKVAMDSLAYLLNCEYSLSEKTYTFGNCREFAE